MLGNPGIRIPLVARLIWATFSLVLVVTLGSKALSSFNFCPRAEIVLSVCNRIPRLFFSPRSIAPLKERGKASEVALPSGTLFSNGLWLEGPLTGLLMGAGEGEAVEYSAVV